MKIDEMCSCLERPVVLTQVAFELILVLVKRLCKICLGGEAVIKPDLAHSNPSTSLRRSENVSRSGFDSRIKYERHGSSPRFSHW